MITALKLLREAANRGWTFEVDGGGDEPDYMGNNPTKAWNAVKETEEAHVVFYGASGRLGVAHLMSPGCNTCDDEETLVNYSCRDGSEFTALCDKLIEEAI